MKREFLLECAFCGVVFVDVEMHVRHEEDCAKRPPDEGRAPALPLGDVPPAILRTLLGARLPGPKS